MERRKEWEIMKRMTRILALLLTLCFAFSLCAFASGEASGTSGEASAAAGTGAFAQVDATHWAGGSLTIEAIEFAPEYADYVDATLFTNISKIVYDGGEIDVDTAKYAAILTVDGVQVDLYNAAGVTYEGDVVLTLVKKAASTNSGNAKFGDDAGSLIGDFYYTAAAYFDENGYVEESSVPAAQYGASVDDHSVSGMEFVSAGDYFSGVYVTDQTVTVSDSRFVGAGKGGDDFTGRGIMVVASGEAQVDILNSVFATQGALRSAIWSGGSATVNVVNTVVQAYNDEDLVPYSTEDNFATPMMQQVPFALGLRGNIRATLDCGQAFISFTDSLIASNGWAVLSTDSGSGTLVAKDTVAVLGYVEKAETGATYDETCTVNGELYGIRYGRVGQESGYVSFCDGFNDSAYGGRWFAPDYIFIITGGSVTIGASEKDRFYGWSDRIGFMNNNSSPSTEMNISEADFDVADTFILIKSKGGAGETISLDDVTLNLNGSEPWSGNILEVIDSDDLGGGPGATTYTVPYGTLDEYLAAPGNGEGGLTSLSISNSALTGNIYNSVGSQNGSQSSFKNDTIAVDLTNASLTGAVSSAYGVHCTADGRTILGTFTVDSYGREGTYDYLTLGRILNFAAPTVNNPVTLSLANSTWTCTGLSYLASLTVDSTSAVYGDVYQNGQKVSLAGAGTYENVTVVPSGADYFSVVGEGLSAISAAAAAGIVPADRSDLVANVDTGTSASGETSAAASGEAS